MDANGYVVVVFVVREEAIDVLCTDWSVRCLCFSLLLSVFFSLSLSLSFHTLLLVHLVYAYVSSTTTRTTARFSPLLLLFLFIRQEENEGGKRKECIWGQTLMNNVLLIVDWSVSLEILSPDRHMQYSIRIVQKSSDQFF